MTPIEKAFEQFSMLLPLLRYPGYDFALVATDGHVHLRVDHTGSDSRTGEELRWQGRQWRLSAHMTDGEFVQTAFMAVMTALEHEAREVFTFMGEAVFDPHYDIYKLVELRRRPDAIQEREPRYGEAKNMLSEIEKEQLRAASRAIGASREPIADFDYPVPENQTRKDVS